MTQYIEAVGRRKTATARVRLYPGTGEIVVNDKPMNVYFGRDARSNDFEAAVVAGGRRVDV